MYNGVMTNGAMNNTAVCERQRLLRAIQAHDFVLTDLSLYLDTHPTCTHGLACYQAHKQMRDEAMAAYTEKYGPLTHEHVTGTWNWVCNPWPWELED